MTARDHFIAAQTRAGVPAAEARTVHAKLTRIGRRGRLGISVKNAIRRADLVMSPMLARAERRAS